jgi:tetratricopeptide (TPR) repeat protein
MRHFRFLALVLGLSLLGAPVWAGDTATEPVPVKKLTPHEMRDETLDILFGSLRKAGNERAAKATEQKIWEVWSQSDSATADVLLGQAVVAMNAYDSASSRAILDQVVESYPTYAEAWNKRATLNFMVGEFDASLADIDKVLELEPRHFGALSGRGMIYQAQEKWGPALQAFKDALAINPNMQSVKDSIADLEKRQPEI